MKRAKLPSFKLCGSGGVVVAVLLHIGQLTAAEYVPPEALLDMQMQELMNVTVTSAGKRHEKYFSTAAAVYVISNDDIRRSGATSIPEALRMAPGVEVQQANANKFAVGIRGQNDTFSDKLLVLMDGRALYTPSFSGVWWLVQNYPLEDIDRIEIIRGPSGAVWGSNAVNGVINIITKQAGKTKGLLISGGAGTEERGFATLRYGWRSEHASYRAYAMAESRDGGIYDSRDPAATNIWGMATGSDAPDARRLGQAGFRVDWDATHLTQVAVIGNAYRVKAGAFGYLASQPGQAHVPYSTGNNIYTGGNLLFRVEHELASDSRFSSQIYLDRYKMDIPAFGEARNTLDAELQLDLPQRFRNAISIGGGYRLSRSDMTGSAVLQMADKSDQLYSLFIQDDIDVIRERLKLTVGLKAEHNQYSGWELQPSLRGIYNGDGWSLWAAASRASRIPNMIDNGIRLSVQTGTLGPFPYVGRVIGDGQVTTEKVTAFEVGLRLHPSAELLFQLTAFKMLYKGVNDVHQDAAAAFIENAYLVVPVYLRNVLNGDAQGIEADLTWQANSRLKLKGSFTHLRSHYVPTPINDFEARYTAFTVTEQTPENRYHLGASLDLDYGIEMDLNFSHWDRFREDRVARYNRLDARIGWRPSDAFEFSLAGKNLLKAAHKEDIGDYLEASTLLQQSYYAKLTYRY